MLQATGLQRVRHQLGAEQQFPLYHNHTSYTRLALTTESFPRQLDKKTRASRGERGLEFSRRKKGQTSFPLHFLGLQNNNVSCWRTVSGLNLLANPVILNYGSRSGEVFTTSRHSLDSFSSVQFNRSVVSNSLRPHESQHTRPPCEFTQTHVHRVSDAIQPSHPLSSPSPPAPNPSQHQGLFQ